MAQSGEMKPEPGRSRIVNEEIDGTVKVEAVMSYEIRGAINVGLSPGGREVGVEESN